MKRPSFQFYPADWLNDAALQACSMEAKGLWITLLCLMHAGVPYGHLSLNSRRTPDELAAKLCRTPLKKYRQLVAELDAAGVLSWTDERTMYSRRMVRDEHAREGWRERQQKHRTVTRDVTPVVTPESRLSSSSSSSSSNTVSDLPIVPTETPHTFPPKGVLEKLKATVKSSPPEDPPETPPARPNGHGQQWSSPAWVRATALLVERPQRPGESAAEWRDAVRDALNARIAAGKAKT